jgi:hypothetical protein
MVGRRSPICENEVAVNDAAAFVCPGCGQPVKPGEDFVAAREHFVEGEVSLHLNGEPSSASAERRFHVGHFRGRLGDRFYELVASHSSR